MSENKNKEVMEETKTVETEKVGVLTKVKGFCKKHKIGLIVGGVATAAVAAFGLVKAFSKSDECDDCYYEEDDYVDSTAEVIEEAE